MNLDALYKELKQYRLSDSLYVLSQISAAFKLDINSFNWDGIPENLKCWLGRMENNMSLKLNVYLSSGRLARYLLLSGANDYRNKYILLEDNSLSKALDMAGGLYEKALEDKLLQSSTSITNSILGRISQQQFDLQENRSNLIGRFYLMFQTIPLILSEKQTYSIEDKMREYFGVGVLEWMLAGFALWLKNHGYIYSDFQIVDERLTNFVSTDSVKIFINLSSGCYRDYRLKIRGNNWKDVNPLKDIYGLDPFAEMPLIKPDLSKQLPHATYLVPQSKHLLNRATVGVFHLLSNKEKELALLANRPKENPFRTYFGEVFRGYVKCQLSQVIEKDNLIDLDEDYKNISKGKIPDFALIEEDVCILFEVKAVLLTLDARLLADENLVQNLIEKGNFNKAIVQLDEFKHKIENNLTGDERFLNVKKVINMMISYEDVYILNSLVLPKLKLHYDRKADNLQLGSISDIESIGTALSEDKKVGKLIWEKIKDKDLENYPLMSFFNLSTKNRVLEQAREDFFNKILNWRDDELKR